MIPTSNIMIVAATQMPPNETRNGPKETPKTPLEFALPVKTQYYVAFQTAVIPSSVYPTFAPPQYVFAD
jgi:hypothetical protein